MVPAAYLANSVPAEGATSVRDATTTFAPCPAKPRHIARPMPRLPPVTIATLPRNVIATPYTTPTLSLTACPMSRFPTAFPLKRGDVVPHRSPDSSPLSPAGGTAHRATTRAEWAVSPRRQAPPARLPVAAHRRTGSGGRPPLAHHYTEAGGREQAVLPLLGWTCVAGRGMVGQSSGPSCRRCRRRSHRYEATMGVDMPT